MFRNTDMFSNAAQTCILRPFFLGRCSLLSVHTYVVWLTNFTCLIFFVLRWWKQFNGKNVWYIVPRPHQFIHVAHTHLEEFLFVAFVSPAKIFSSEQFPIYSNRKLCKACVNYYLYTRDTVQPMKCLGSDAMWYKLFPDLLMWGKGSEWHKPGSLQKLRVWPMKSQSSFIGTRQK